MATVAAHVAPAWSPTEPPRHAVAPLVDWMEPVRPWPNASNASLQLAALLFVGTAVWASQALFRMGKVSSAHASHINSGMQMRRNLVAWLAVANLVRFVSLALELAESGRFSSDTDVEHWVRDLVAMLPALVFLSAFSVVVLFWAQLHYTTTMVPLPLLQCLFICGNIACYVLVSVVAVVTFFMEAYGHFLLCTICILGILNIIVAFTFLFYGFRVVAELAETARKKVPGRKLTWRVTTLCVVCPLALLLRGCAYLAWCLDFGSPTWTADLALCVLGEWLPSVATIAILSPLRPPGTSSPVLSVSDSTDSEEPLLQAEHVPQRGNSGGNVGVTWKQLYPEPEK